VSTDRNLQEVAAKLDDMSLTLEELKEKVKENAAVVPQELHQLQNEVQRAAEKIEGVVDPELPE
jgi:hypothetical protein